MKEISLKSLRLENFKCHRELFLKLDGDSRQICGGTEKGKTSIYDAWCWLLYGKDSQGRTLTEVRPLSEDGSFRDPGARTRVTGEICTVQTMDLKGRGPEKILKFQRSLQKDPEGMEQWEFCLDGRPCGRTVYEEAVAELLPEEYFWLLTDPLRFAEQLTGAQKLEILLGMLPDPGTLPAEKKELKPLLEAMQGQDPRAFREKLRREKQALLKNGLPYRISELEGTRRQLGYPDYETLKKRREGLAVVQNALLNAEKPDLFRIRSIGSSLQTLDRTLGLETVTEACSQRLLKLRREQNRILSRLGEIRRLEGLLDLFFRLQAEICEQELEQVFEQELTVTFPEEKTGTGCRIFRKGIPFENLSRTERIKAGLCILNFLSCLWEVSVPVFLEDWPPDQPAQTMFAQCIGLCSENTDHSRQGSERRKKN